MATKAKCKVYSDGSVCLQEILNSFNSSISEEHAWALCYQCAKFFLESGQQPYPNIANADRVFLQTDGNIHSNTLQGQVSNSSRSFCSEQELTACLGCVIYSTLDHGCNDEEERCLSQDLEGLINDMITDKRSLLHHETDDEGIERDSEEADEDRSTSRFIPRIALQEVITRCERHLASLTKSQAEAHYRAVVRALVAEAIELATFLEKVTSSHFVEGTGNRELEKLQFADWARFWVQVIQELRTGVKLKKVSCSRAPIEYELTPYEILMNDIKSCRYNLRKIMVDGNVPSRVTKDAHAIILDFIRSRPTLKKVSDRKLAPLSRTLTPWEKLMTSIRKGRTLRKTHSMQRSTESISPDKIKGSADVNTRKLIKVDFSKLIDDDDDLSDTSEDCKIWQEGFNQVYENVVEAYDLALQCPPPKMTGKRHALNVHNDHFESYSVPHSRPCSRQSCTSSEAESIQLTEEIAQALQDNTKPWHEAISLDDRLSLTLEEIVHIRTVLTKAEVEALPVEGHVKSDVENRKVCFLCLKTRFGLLGPWGHRCNLCKRTVCTKCISKMYIPMEHFSSVPVVLLSPSIMATPEDECNSFNKQKSSQGEGGSTSSNSSRQPSPSRPSSSVERFRRQNTVRPGVTDKLRGSQMAVCLDCKMMVLQIIKSAQANRSAIRNKHLQSLTLNISPVF